MTVMTTPAQKIVLGIGQLQTIVAQMGVGRLMLVAGKSFDTSVLYESVANLPVELVRFSDYAPNPLYEDVCKGVSLFRSEKCDGLLAVGGGSSIDVAKCIKLFSGLDESRNYLEQDYRDSIVPLVAVPTTAGTGSESTRFAVIYYKGAKQSVTHESIIPNYAILEPSVLASLPEYQKKCTLMDALCQGIESLWSVNSTEESTPLSVDSIKTIVGVARNYVMRNESAEQMIIAANKAGQAINITQTTAAHAFSYKITSLLGLPHGHAVAVCLPEIWEYMLNHTEKCIDPRGVSYLESRFCLLAQAFGTQTSRDALAAFRGLLDDLGLERPVCKEKRGELLSTLAGSVNPVRLKNNPVQLDLDAISALYKKIVK